MDVEGKVPTTEAGKCLRHSAWSWRPLWDYAANCGKDLIDYELWKAGHCNNGDGLGAVGARELAKKLRAELSSGRTAGYERAYQQMLAAMPDKPCQFCGATGIRTDIVGWQQGMPARALDLDTAKELGRKVGWCNGCEGRGRLRPSEACYPFSTDNVREFCEFLEGSGGFEIW
jgi:hypothetical protein